MPAATSYTEASLAAFLAAEVGPVGDVLGWTTGGGVGSYSHPIDRALAALGVTTIDEVTNVRALEAVAIREVWRRAINHLATKYSFSLDQQSFSRSDMAKLLMSARGALALAEAAAALYDESAAPVMIIDRFRDDLTPYDAQIQDDRRVLA